MIKVPNLKNVGDARLFAVLQHSAIRQSKRPYRATGIGDLRRSGNGRAINRFLGQRGEISAAIIASVANKVRQVMKSPRLGSCRWRCVIG